MLGLTGLAGLDVLSCEGQVGVPEVGECIVQHEVVFSRNQWAREKKVNRDLVDFK